MKTTVKNLSETKVLLTIVVDKAELDAAEQVSLAKLAKSVKVSGFRKGNVPLAVAKKNIDPATLAEQTLEDALSKAVAEAFISENIQVLERPSVEIKKYVPNQTLEFTAEADCLPPVKLGNYKKLTSSIKPEKVNTKDIEDVISRIAAGMGEKKPVDRAAKLGDEAVIDFIGKKDDVAFDGGTGNDYPLTLGSNSFIPGFEESVVGMKPGETKDIKLAFPDDYHVADLAGQDVVFTTTLKSVNEVTEPKLDDEFAAKAGPFTTMKELRDDIKRELTAQKEREAREKTKDDLVGKLIEVSEVPAPDVLIRDQMQSIEQDMEQNLMYQGVTLDQYLANKNFKDKETWLESEVKNAATMRVQAGLALAELTKSEKITATDDEITKHIDTYRAQYANNPEMAKRFDEPEVQRDLANRLVTEKTVDRLVELNTPKASIKK